MLLLLGEPLPSHLFWDVAAHREHQTHRLVPEVGGLAEHARAAAVDYGNALLAAVARGRLGDAPGAGATVHPNVVDAELGTLAHRLLGDLGPGRDHDRIDTIGDRAQIVVAPVPLDLLGVRVDREHLVSPLAKALVDDVAPMILRMPRDARDRHPLVGQKLRRRLLNLLHPHPLLRDWLSTQRHPAAAQREARPQYAVRHRVSTPIRRVAKYLCSRRDCTSSIAVR